MSIGLHDARNTARLAWQMISDGCVMQITKSLQTVTNQLLILTSCCFWFSVLFDHKIYYYNYNHFTVLWTLSRTIQVSCSSKSRLVLPSWFYFSGVGSRDKIQEGRKMVVCMGGRLYTSCMWSSMLHRSETWPMRKENEVAEMRMVTGQMDV